VLDWDEESDSGTEGIDDFRLGEGSDSDEDGYGGYYGGSSEDDEDDEDDEESTDEDDDEEEDEEL
jgi:hypothetical protein